MSKMKIVGIISDFVQNDKHTTLKTPFYRVRQMYVDAIKKNSSNDILIIIIPYLFEDMDKYVDLCDGVLLVGGDDIPPEMYGEKQISEDPVLKIRYDFEIPFVKKYIKTNKPILGICAGMQVINVALNGTLHQEIANISKEDHRQKEDFYKTFHQVNIKKDTLLYKISNKEKIYTNSMHHQAINIVGDGLSVSALSNNGIIEAIEKKDHSFCLGTQWHPEWYSSEIDKEIFKTFCFYVKK